MPWAFARGWRVHVFQGMGLWGHLEDAGVADVVHVQVEILQVRPLGDVCNRLRSLQRDAAGGPAPPQVCVRPCCDTTCMLL